jgi:hypothetical protein
MKDMYHLRYYGVDSVIKDRTVSKRVSLFVGHLIVYSIEYLFMRDTVAKHDSLEALFFRS